jgi:hypothetical protein
LDTEVMRDLYDTFTAPDGTQLGNAPGKYASVEVRLASWREANPEGEFGGGRRGEEANRTPAAPAASPTAAGELVPRLKRRQIQDRSAYP